MWVLVSILVPYVVSAYLTAKKKKKKLAHVRVGPTGHLICVDERLFYRSKLLTEISYSILCIGRHFRSRDVIPLRACANASRSKKKKKKGGEARPISPSARVKIQITGRAPGSQAWRGWDTCSLEEEDTGYGGRGRWTHRQHVVIRWTAQSRIKINSQDVTSADLRQAHERERESR